MASAVSTAGAAERLTVFAAASLKTALDAVAAAWTAETSREVSISYAASSALAKQIEAGAPADIFISADRDWLNYLADRKLLKDGSEVDLLGNEIVLVAPKDSKVETTIAAGFPLAALIGGGRLAMADVKAVPAGKYGKAALASLGVWPSVESRIAQAENVRAALKLVATGEAALGIVYATDARAEPAVKIVGTFPPNSHPPIVYPVAIVAASTSPDAAGFEKFLQSPKAKAIFEAQGFIFLAPVASN
ncbi:MAG: molybdate ABC transporter substrate-binding protein [Rhizobiales bacterium]|nr:molybdate ABC transporter substrate-binding protein [Hyphomicrobiales bacterium]